MARFVLTAFLLCLTASVGAQPSRDLPPLVFDDLSYAAAEWSSQDDRPLGERSVFGLNPWCEGLACADTVVTRAWYQYLWRENGFQPTDPLSRIEPDTTGTGALGFAMLAGDHGSSWSHQLASGFSARTGVWVARADFSPLPVNGVGFTQAFWLLAPHEAVKPGNLEAYRGTEKGRVEVDFELNNWFGFAEGADSYLSTALFENSERAALVPMRAERGAPSYSCTLTDTDGRTQTAGPAECARFLVADGVWTTMLFRSDGETVRFEVRADGPDGTLHAASDVQRENVPSQTMTTMISQHRIESVDATGTGRLTQDQRVVFDWVYWSPEADRSMDDIRADVSVVQAARVDGRRVTRLRTTPARLRRPYTNAPNDRPFRLRRETPPQLRIDGPDRLDVFRRDTYSARLDDVIGTFRIDWSQRAVYRDGSVGEWSVPKTAIAFHHDVQMPLLVACLDVRASAQPMDYTVVPDGEGSIVEWVPPVPGTPPDLQDVRRTCKAWAPSDLRSARTP